MRKVIKVSYIILTAVEALLIVSAIVFVPFRPEMHSIKAYLCFCGFLAVIVSALIIACTVIDAVIIKKRCKKTACALVKLVAEQKDCVRFIALMSQALLLDDKLGGKSRLYIKKINQQAEHTLCGVTAAEALIKRLT
ncbi:MAG: hypothetical protein PHC84_01935 [Clostridia bacterium]|nr:hypothetical protein [Clostridia bacterium]